MSVVDILMPVYADLPATKACLESLIASDISGLAELQIIYDCGPDPELEQYLHAFEHQHEAVHLYKNTHNLGFVKTINKGFRLHPERDVIILNSDTQVFGDWVARFLAIAKRDPRIATITPFSNNAEICSFPTFCAINTLPEHVSLLKLDSVFSKTLIDQINEIPTGVGFCMFVRRKALNDVGLFDEETFGRGYGEENDFCRRVANVGYRNVIASNIFVYHEGGASFGAEKMQLVEAATAKVEKKHPGYIKQVHEFIESDPLRPARIAAMIGLLKASAKPLVLAITHNLGGGTKQYLDQLIATKQCEFDTLLLQPLSGEVVILHLPAWMNESFTFHMDDDQADLLSVLQCLGISLVIVNHLKGVERCAARLVSALKVSSWCILHDYYFIGGNPTLTNADGHFPVGQDTEGTISSLPASMNWEEWRECVHNVLLNAERLVAPTESVRNFYRQWLPELNLDIEIHPHQDQEMCGGYAGVPVQPGNVKNRVVVIGALSKEKGADLLDAVAKIARRQYPAIEFHLLGYAYRPLAKSVITHGPYREQELVELLEQLQPELVWYPCQWPETYSYTLSRVLDSGYPLLIPDLGALADRTKGRPLTRSLPYPQAPTVWLEQIVDMLASLHDRPAERWKTSSPPEPFYGREWQLEVRRGAIHVDREALNNIISHRTVRREEESLGEHLIRLLFWFRELPLIRVVARMIPIQWQRRLKRYLSSKPVHDVFNQNRGF